MDTKNYFVHESSSTYDHEIPFESFKQFEECFKLYKEKLK